MAWAHQRTSSSANTYKVTANPPTPPNWTSSLDAARNQLNPYHKIQVPSNSAEYHVLCSMMGPITQVTKIERVVNLQLWKKFTGARKDLLSAKSNDLKLLAQLGLSEEETQHKIRINLNYKKNHGQGPEFTPYSDNVVLLHHGSRAPLDTILSQGLDERLGRGGNHGRGIYFADDPGKSMGYDSNSALLVCMVYLGDCQAVGSGGGLVREPEKAQQKRRNPADLFFDSIVAAMPHEFVIFNRYHCYPLYVVNYQRGGGAGYGYRNARDTTAATNNPPVFTNARQQLPPFVWGVNQMQTTRNEGVSSYPFFASSIFNDMRADQIQISVPIPIFPRLNKYPHQRSAPNAVDCSTNDQTKSHKPSIVSSKFDEEEMSIRLSRLVALGFENQDKNLMAVHKFGDDFESILDFLISQEENADAANQNHQTQGPPEVAAIEGQLASLYDFGFVDRETNKEVLSRFGYDLEKTINYLLNEEHETSSVLPTQQAIINNTLLSFTTAVVDDNELELEECAICAMEYPKSAFQKWKILTCKHKLCATCYSHLQTTSSTMSGQLHTFVKCPFCGACSGDAEIGTCPNGSMTVIAVPYTHVNGYEESFGAIQITYNVSRCTTAKVGYLPNSSEGQRILQLLRAAWDRRLIFRIGSGSHAAVEWNITHNTHSTCLNDEDSTYLTKVQAELKQYGIQ